MIVRVWGTINNKELEFNSMPSQPGYWEGFGPRNDLYQYIEIWAKNDLGAIGHLKCTVIIKEYTPTISRLILAPYFARLLQPEEINRYI